MNENNILLQLGALQRNRDAEQDEWEALARGEASAATVTTSRLAAGADQRQVDELATILDSPIDLQRWVDVGLQATKNNDDVQPPETAHNEKPTSNVIWLTAGAALLAAALALLWLVPQGPATSPELPTYTLLVRNQTVQVDRGEPVASESAYRPTSDVLWVIRPEHGTDFATEVAVLAQRNGAPPKLLVPPKDTTSISKDGVVQLRGNFGDIFPLEPGQWQIQVLVGQQRPTDLHELEQGGAWTMTAPTTVTILPAK